MVYKLNDCNRQRIKTASSTIRDGYYTTHSKYLEAKYKCSSCGINDAPKNQDYSYSTKLAMIKYNALKKQ
tara:strand:+ start:3584 stop:3793 length:210 start_codon:yes stop_codon:yes gene_type:complete